MTELSPIAEEILQERYYDRDPQGNLIEDWDGLSRRVANAIADVELLYKNDPANYREDFYQVINDLDFIPNTPTLMNAGSIGGLGLLSACFVQIPDDSMGSIMDHAKYSALLFQSGAGVGYNFSNLRGSGEMVSSSMRESSGALSFMKNIFNSIGEVVKQGGRRRAAMMGLLDDDHPELEQFVTFKNKEDSLANFNISIMASDDFMRAIEQNRPWYLKARTSGNVTKTINARTLFNSVARNNWRMAEPGMIFKDEINRHNPIAHKQLINCVNPCGEATLFNYENCCLGSINIMNHISNGQIDWSKLERTITIAIRFLDNVVDANRHVDPKFSDASLYTRRIGLGITGFADALVHMESRYGSDHSLEIASTLGSYINHIATTTSIALGKEKGPYPGWHDGSWHKEQGLPLRNISLLAIAPEGSRSLISSTSPSIEPNFGRTIVRTSKGIGSGEWKHPLADNKNFVTTYEVSLSEHIKMQAAWQKELNFNMVGQSISKTNNAPKGISEEELGEAYLEAWRLGCKGITMYRAGSRDAVYYEATDDEKHDEYGRLEETKELVTVAASVSTVASENGSGLSEYSMVDENGDDIRACSIGGGCEG